MTPRRRPEEAARPMAGMRVTGVILRRLPPLNRSDILRQTAHPSTSADNISASRSGASPNLLELLNGLGPVGCLGPIAEAGEQLCDQPPGGGRPPFRAPNFEQRDRRAERPGKGPLSTRRRERLQEL